jgi:hypothetical protein
VDIVAAKSRPQESHRLGTHVYKPCIEPSRHGTSRTLNEQYMQSCLRTRFIANIKDVICTRAMFARNFVADLLRSSLLVQKKCTGTFPNKGIPLIR